MYTDLDVTDLPSGVVGLKLFAKDGVVPCVEHSPVAVLQLMKEREFLDQYKAFLAACTPPQGAASSDSPGVLLMRTERAIAHFRPQFTNHQLAVHLCTHEDSDSSEADPSTSSLVFVDQTVNADYVPQNAVQVKCAPSQSQEVERFTLPWSNRTGQAVGSEPKGASPKSKHKDKFHVHDDHVPNMAGKWLNTSLEGNMDKFMEAMGISEPIRKAAASTEYGVGKQVQEIAQKGNAFEIKSTTMKGDPVYQKFVVGQGPQVVRTSSLKIDMEVEPMWVDGKVLEIESKTNEDELLVTRRYLRGPKLVMEQELKGIVVKRIFSKR